MKIKFFLFYFFLPAFLFAQAPGVLDSTFSDDGKLTMSIGSGDDAIYSIAVQEDGKIVAAGKSFNGFNDDFVVTRFLSNGNPDSSFGGDGIIITPIGDDYDAAWSVAIQEDGKIVAGGTTHNILNYNEFALTRYKTDGELDSSFGEDGIVTFAINFHYIDMIRAIVIQPDGKIIAAGFTWNGTIGDFALARFNTDGTIDTTLSGDGKHTTNFGSNNDGAYAVGVQEDGKIVAVGYYTSPGVSYDFALARYQTYGSLDDSFSGDGKLITHIPTDTREANAMAIQTDGKIIAAGSAGMDASGNMDFAIARYNSNGTLDSTFNDTGIVKTSFGEGWDQIQSIVLQEDGKIVAGGYTKFGIENGDFALARYNIDGSLDTIFGEDGIVRTDFETQDDYIFSLALQPDGKIMAGGWTYNGSNMDFALARYESEFMICSDSIINQPADMEVNTDSTAFFYVSSTNILTTYQWQTDFGGGWENIIDGGQYTGSNKDTLFISDVTLANNNQNFRCIVGDAPCLDTTVIAILAVNEIQSGLNQQIKSAIKIYPNPATDQLFIETSLEGNFEIEIFDARGKKIFNQSANSNITIPINNFSKGIYFLKITNEGGMSGINFIKE